MRFLYLTIRFLPYWAIPLGLTFFEMAMIFRRRGNHTLKISMFVVGGFFLLLTCAFFYFRWDVTLYPWFRDRLGFEYARAFLGRRLVSV